MILAYYRTSSRRTPPPGKACGKEMMGNRLTKKPSALSAGQHRPQPRQAPQGFEPTLLGYDHFLPASAP
ncbi:MAG: hypothetical protein ACLT8E_06415 [Akkermansia sp.]